MDVVVVSDSGKDGANGVVGRVGFYDELSSGLIVCEYWSGGKRFLEGFERFAAFVVEVPRDVLASEASKWDGYVRVILNETTIKVSKTKERLDVFDYPKFRPVEDGLDLVFGHSETVRS